MALRSLFLLQHRWVRWTLYLGFMTLLGLINTGQSYLYCTAYGTTGNFRFWPTLALGVCDWYLWAALTPAIIWLAHRFPFYPERWGRSLAVHLACNLLMSFIVFMFTIPVFRWVSPGAQERSIWFWIQGRANAYMILYFWIYWAILGSILSTQYYRQFRDRELKATRLEGKLAQAQLQVLKMQLHPHFLFNTLNAISALLHKDAESADVMIARLGELLRTTLENVGTQEIPLRQELEFIQPYLEIEKARLGDRLQVEMHIDPEAMDAAVPNLILQPIVENSIRHGIAPYTQKGRINIRACRENGALRMEVEDNGPGLSLEQQVNFRPGVGITNTRARLQQLYGLDHEFEMKNGDARGFVVKMIIPARETAPLENGHANGMTSNAAISTASEPIVPALRPS
jgi:two-component system, LytTR family, sensor kinase